MNEPSDLLFQAVLGVD